jgi:hypothetical protein
MLYEHDEVTGFSLYSVSCKHNAVGLLDGQRYFCTEALAQQVISLQFGDIAGFVYILLNVLIVVQLSLLPLLV